MNELVTESELAQARDDPAFRQEFLAGNLGRLLEALKIMRGANGQDPKTGASDQGRRGSRSKTC